MTPRNLCVVLVATIYIIGSARASAKSMPSTCMPFQQNKACDVAFSPPRQLEIENDTRVLSHKEAHLDPISRGGAIFQPDKRHPLFGTNLLKPILYPSLDGFFQFVQIPLIYYAISGTAQKVQAILMLVHFPLYFLTNYGCQFLSLPMLPFSLMFWYDTIWGVFNIISPFFMEGYDGVMKWIYSCAFGLVTLPLFTIFDPKPSDTYM